MPRHDTLCVKDHWLLNHRYWMHGKHNELCRVLEERRVEKNTAAEQTYGEEGDKLDSADWTATERSNTGDHHGVDAVRPSATVPRILS